MFGVIRDVACKTAYFAVDELYPLGELIRRDEARVTGSERDVAHADRMVAVALVADLQRFLNSHGVLMAPKAFG